MEKTISVKKIAYSVDEISEMTTLSKPFIWGEIREGNLPSRKFGRRRLVLKDDFDLYIARGSEGWRKGQE